MDRDRGEDERIYKVVVALFQKSMLFHKSVACFKGDRMLLSRARLIRTLGAPATIHIWMSNVLRSGGLEPCGHVSHRVRAVLAFRPR